MRSDGLAAHGLAALLALALGLWALGAAERPAPERTLALLLLLQAACIGLAPRLTGVRLALWPLLLCGWAVLGWVLLGGQLLRGPAASTLAFLALQLATLAAWQRLLGADDDARPARRAALLAAWVLLVAGPLWALPGPQWALRLSPLSHSALAAQIDWLHLDWFYRHLPLAGLPLEYPAWHAVLVGQSALALVAALALTLRRHRPPSNPDLESAP
jgi:hypothetical protein